MENVLVLILLLALHFIDHWLHLTPLPSRFSSSTSTQTLKTMRESSSSLASRRMMSQLSALSILVKTWPNTNQKKVTWMLNQLNLLYKALWMVNWRYVCQRERKGIQWHHMFCFKMSKDCPLVLYLFWHMMTNILTPLMGVLITMNKTSLDGHIWCQIDSNI